MLLFQATGELSLTACAQPEASYNKQHLCEPYSLGNWFWDMAVIDVKFLSHTEKTNTLPEGKVDQEESVRSSGQKSEK